MLKYLGDFTYFICQVMAHFLKNIGLAGGNSCWHGHEAKLVQLVLHCHESPSSDQNCTRSHIERMDPKVHQGPQQAHAVHPQNTLRP
jgi:hypothetical protein